MSTLWTLPGCPRPPAWHIDWPRLLERYSLLSPLAHCAQDQYYHPEGNVLAHTRLVCEALVGLEQWRRMSEEGRSILFAAALFHDVGKGRTSVHEPNGRISAIGHAAKGARLARAALYRAADIPTARPPLAVREKIVALIRNHRLPLSWANHEDVSRTISRATLEIPGRWLALLGRADAAGRLSVDKQTLLDSCAMFEELCAECGCLDEQRHYPSSLARYLYLNGERPCAEYVSSEPVGFPVVLMAGLPGAGKDTWIAARAAGRAVVSLDAIRRSMKVSPRDNQGKVVDAARDAARRLLRRKEPFIWNGTNLSLSIRGALVRLFRNYGAHVEIVYLECPYQELLERNQRRQHTVPRRVIERLIDRLDIPTYVEAPDLHRLTTMD